MDAGSGKGVVLFGPWIGELGWELMAWQAWCRQEAKKFDKAYVCSFPDMKALYEDFAEFVPHGYQYRALDWDKKENIDKVQFEKPDDVTAQVLPFKRYKAGGEFIRFGRTPVFDYKFLLHARAINRGGKNYPLDLWQELAEKLSEFGGVIASIGSAHDHLIPGTYDMRAISLQALANIMAGCKCVVGGSSGTMHFAALCAPRLVTWGDSRTYFGEMLGERYAKTWNPFNTPFHFIYNDEWKPEVSDIVKAVFTEEITVPPADQSIAQSIVQPIVQPGDKDVENPPLPRELRNKLLQAARNKRYFITISTIENGRQSHYYIRTDFPLEDMTGSLLHLMNEIKLKEIKKLKSPLRIPQVIDNETPTETGTDQWT